MEEYISIINGIWLIACGDCELCYKHVDFKFVIVA